MLLTCFKAYKVCVQKMLTKHSFKVRGTCWGGGGDVAFVKH